MSVNPNGEAEVLKVYFKPRPRLKKVIVDLDFSTLAIKGRQSQGNLFSRYGIHKIVLKERGASTLGGLNVWFDEDVRRLNSDGRGKWLGEFKGDGNRTRGMRPLVGDLELRATAIGDADEIGVLVEERLQAVARLGRETLHVVVPLSPVVVAEAVNPVGIGPRGGGRGRPRGGGNPGGRR